MILGKGMLASAFREYDFDNTIIFASGVSNSQETRNSEFQREQKLLSKTLINNSDKKIIYFSSCALEHYDDNMNPYYKHKKSMENLIASDSNNYLICRLPQVIGTTNNKYQLINYFASHIQNDNEFQVFQDATRYLIDIRDIAVIVSFLIKSNDFVNQIICLANPTPYNIYDIITKLEDIFQKKAKTILITKTSHDHFDLIDMKKIIYQFNLNKLFENENYLLESLIFHYTKKGKNG